MEIKSNVLRFDSSRKKEKPKNEDLRAVGVSGGRNNVVEPDVFEKNKEIKELRAELENLEKKADALEAKINLGKKMMPEEMNEALRRLEEEFNELDKKAEGFSFPLEAIMTSQAAGQEMSEDKKRKMKESLEIKKSVEKIRETIISMLGKDK